LRSGENTGASTGARDSFVDVRAQKISVSMAQIAASIEYETAPPPTGLPDDMHALPGASLLFLSIKAIDGFKVQAALVAA
jgi:hypothetical protein